MIRRGYGTRSRRSRPWRLPFAVVQGVMAGVLVWALGWVGSVLTPAPVKPIEAELEAARRAFDSGNLNEAIAAAERAFAARPDWPPAALEMVRALVYRSYVDYDDLPDRRRALELSGAVLEAHPDDPNALAARAFA
nr:hypothetical protein [Anaerolineae bacterium]